MTKSKLRLRKALSAVLSLLIVISAAMCVPVTAGAVAYDSDPNNFSYYFYSDMTAEIRAYKGDSEYVKIPSTINGYKITNLSNGVFENNRKLKGIIIPDTVTVLSSYAFSDCISLAYVDLGKGITSLDNCTFKNCQSLKSITIPQQIKTIYDDVFLDCVNLKTIYLNAKNLSWMSDTFDLPSVTDLVIGSTVESLRDGAFSGFSYLENVTIENGLMVIPYKCFKNCTGIKSITLPDSVMSVGESAFENCKNIKSVNFSKNLNTISSLAFKGCSSIESLNFTSNLREISESAFEDCSTVKNITFNEALNTIGKSAFKNCSSVETIDLPSNLSFLGVSAFANCSSLTSAVLSEKLSYLSSGVFSNCSKLKSINIGDNISEIGSECFAYCTDLQSVDLGKNVQIIGSYAFFDCESLKSVEIPSSVMYIYEGAFIDCTNLSSVKLNYGLKGIYSYAFYNCLNLKKVEIPSSVSDLYNYSFGYYGQNNNNYKLPDFIIRGYLDTEAQRYANDNGFKFRNAAIPEPSSVVLDKKTLTLGVGESCTLKQSLNPSNAVSDYSWSVSNKNVVAVNNGKVTAKSVGTAAVTVTTENGKKAICKITVKKAPASVALNVKTKNLVSGKSFTITATVPSDSAGSVVWSSSNNNVATVKNGVVTGKNSGTAVITAKTYNGKTATCKVSVTKPPVWVKLNLTSGTMGVGQSATLKATLSPGSTGTVTWSTSNSRIATVKNGKITARAVGKATITVKTNNGKKAVCKVTVKKAPSSVKLNKTSIVLGIADKYTLKRTLSANSAGPVTWSTSNKNVVTVTNGKLVTKKAGTATITVKTYNGKKATCKVTVINGKRKHFYSEQGGWVVANYSFVVPNSCRYEFSGKFIDLNEKYNYNKSNSVYGWHGSGYVGSVFFTDDPYNLYFHKLGKKNGYYFGYITPTGVEFNPNNKTSVKKYNAAWKEFLLAMKTFRFE